MQRTLANRAQRGGGGFTLIELLVVMAIIALLIGILMPVLGKVRREARATACAAALQQLGVAWTSYVNDHPRHLPDVVTFPSPIATAPPEERTIMDALERYLDAPAAFRCAGDDRGYFTDYGTSYEYLPGWAVTLMGDTALLSPEQAMRYGPILPVLADAETFHPHPAAPQRRQAVFYDAHVAWWDE